MKKYFKMAVVILMTCLTKNLSSMHEINYEFIKSQLSLSANPMFKVKTEDFVTYSMACNDEAFVLNCQRDKEEGIITCWIFRNKKEFAKQETYEFIIEDIELIYQMFEFTYKKQKANLEE